MTHLSLLIELYMGDAALQVAGIEITHQEIGLSTNEPGQNFVVAKFDGILGLSYPSISAGGETPVMDNMMHNNLLQADMFAFYLSRYHPPTVTLSGAT